MQLRKQMGSPASKVEEMNDNDMKAKDKMNKRRNCLDWESI